MEKGKILRAAQRKAGMLNRSKSDVVRYVCEQTNVPMPATWQQRYALMKSWAVPVEPAKKAKAAKGPDTSIPHVPPIRGAQRRKRKAVERAKRDEFLFTYEWRQLRMRVITKRGARCECCGATPKQDGITINVDHVKPRLHYPELALEESNLQILCNVCNHGKGNWDETDWRPRLVERA